MSWGYFVELDVTLPAKAWTALKKETPADHPLDAKWSRFEDASLRTAFAPPSGKSAQSSFAQILAWNIFREECARAEEKTRDRVHLRLALCLDKSQLGVAGHLGALLEAVRARGGEGRLAFVNDGSFSGEDGHELVVRDGKRTRRKLRDWNARREALTRELYPEEWEDDGPSEPAPPFVVEAEPEPDLTHDPAAAMADAVALYQQGSPHGARDRLTEYFDAGGPLLPDLLTNYTAFLRMSAPRGDALERAHARVLGAFRESPELLGNVALLENAVAFLNENGRARESIDLALDAIERGTAWSIALATNVTHSAHVADDEAGTKRLLDRVLPAIERGLEDGALFVNVAVLLLRRGDPEAALDWIERARRANPALREETLTDDDFAALRDHPRWIALTGSSTPGSRTSPARSTRRSGR